MLAQTVFLLWGCDWDLCGDEAEYWAWSRKLDWSYFSRGPVIAWLIRLGTEAPGRIEPEADRLAHVRRPFSVRHPRGPDRVGGLPAGGPDDRERIEPG